MPLLTGTGCATLLALIQGCKIIQTTTSGGTIMSASGNHDCAEASTCEIDVPNGERFAETFTAVARHGYAFAGWRGSESYLCAGGSPTCVVDIPASVTTYDATGFMTAEFYPQPELVYPGLLGVENHLWQADAFNDNIGHLFAADFDNDGDDDVLIAAETNPAEEFAGVRAGLILINDGDYTFTVAAGDRPSSVGPRETLMADFNGDGMKDFFIADHGHDVDPFPGWSNQLLLWTADGYVDVSDRLPDDTTGFTHNAAVGDLDGDGDIDIVVANHGGEFMAGNPYLLLNDGEAQFTVDTSRLPDRVATDYMYRAWVVDVADLDGDGHQDLLMEGGNIGTGESYVYWGSSDGEYRDENVTVLVPPESFFGPEGGGHPISSDVNDINGDGLQDILLGGYNPAGNRRLQILVNTGDRNFNDETRRRLGNSAWSPDEFAHAGHRFLDFNNDGTLDIVPELYDTPNILAWLNDGTGHYVALRSTLFNDADALKQFAEGLRIRDGAEFKSVTLFGDGEVISADAGVVVTAPIITLAE